jgi:pantetheine-phosphate adenylyltransferase
MIRAIYPGTFDPITIGHIDIIKRASLIFDELIIAIADNQNKKPLFSLAERHELVKKSLTTTSLSNVKIVTFSSLLVDLAQKHQAKILIRGLRAVSDFEYEFQMSCMNSKLNKDIQTIFLAASDNVQFISSRFVKQIALLNGDISALVTPNIISDITKKL